jgi:multisubunit Na+/H+ antiporter MnhB subunit
MAKYISSFLTILFVLATTLVFSQENQPVDMADTMRSNGKIYVVVAVIVTLFLGIVLYLISLDRKISKLEKETNQG